jgi:hypothetical protein
MTTIFLNFHVVNVCMYVCMCVCLCVYACEPQASRGAHEVIKTKEHPTAPFVPFEDATLELPRRL